MSHAPTVMPDRLSSLLRRGLTVLGIAALLVAAASTLPAYNASAMLHAGQDVARADCPFDADSGCGGHMADASCTIHGGCISIGVLPAAPALAAAPRQDRVAVPPATVSGRADFPAKPPPISLA